VPAYRPKERVITKIDPSIYDAYVGDYEVAPGLVLSVTKENDKLFSQSPGQARSEMLPDRRPLSSFDAQFTFVREVGSSAHSAFAYFRTSGPSGILSV
jgi:Domain of unknown function (DUF3471)